MKTNFLFALAAFSAIMLTSCGGDKSILAENAAAMDETLSGADLSMFGKFDGVDYDDESNELMFDIKDSRVKPATVKDNFDKFGPVLFKYLFLNYDKRRALIDQKVKALDTKVVFEIKPLDGVEKAIVNIPAAKYHEINGLVIAPEDELEARISAKDEIYGLPLQLDKGEQVTDLAYADGKLIVTIAVSPESLSTIANNEVYFKQHGIEIIQNRLHDDGALCAEGNMAVILRYVGTNGKGSKDVELGPTVVASRLR